MVTSRVHQTALLGRLDQRARLSSTSDRERLLADDVDAVLECSEGLDRVDVVRGADVEDVDVLALEQLGEVVIRLADAERRRALTRTAGNGDQLDAQRLERERVHAGDEAGADDRRAHQREARNICVSTSMSSRAPSGGVRQGVPSTMQSWK